MFIRQHSCFKAKMVYQVCSLVSTILFFYNIVGKIQLNNLKKSISSQKMSSCNLEYGLFFFLYFCNSRGLNCKTCSIEVAVSSSFSTIKKIVQMQTGLLTSPNMLVLKLTRFLLRLKTRLLHCVYIKRVVCFPVGWENALCLSS